MAKTIITRILADKDAADPSRFGEIVYKSASLQVCESASLQVCKSASLRVCESASLQVCESASLQVCHDSWRRTRGCQRLIRIRSDNRRDDAPVHGLGGIDPKKGCNGGSNVDHVPRFVVGDARDRVPKPKDRNVLVAVPRRPVRRPELTFAMDMMFCQPDEDVSRPSGVAAE